MLRAEELACRTGWQKDFYQASEDDQALAEALSRAALPADQGTLPIGHGISARPAGEVTERLPKVTIPAVRPATAFPTARRRAAQAGAGGTLSSIAPARAAQEPAIALGASLQGHPELGENGEMIRKPTRTMVADAHRKALERREAERELALARRQEQHEAAIATIFPTGKPAGVNGTTAHGAAGGDSPSRLTEPPRQSRPAPSSPPATSPFGLSGAPLPIEPRPVLSPALPKEADDRPLAVGHHVAIAATIEQPGRSADALNLPLTPAGGQLASAPTLPTRRDPDPLPATPADPGRGTAPARYWDEPGGNGRFLRMRQEAQEPPVARPEPQAVTVPNVGRPRAEEAPAPVESPSGRTIKPLQPLGTAASEADTVPVPSPARIPRPASAVTEVRTPEPKLPAMPPRQMDEQLVRQLQQDWRERALAAHSGQRCGTCRFFRVAGQAERGSCGCSLADCHHQAMGRNDLGCLDSFGTWWAADDAGWLEKTDFGPRQPTPMIDQLLREWGIPDMPQVVEERRRSAR